MPRQELNILHVEDDPADAVLVREMLQEESAGNATFKVVNVNCLKDALKNLRKQGFNAVILDLGLRDVLGLDNVKAIKAENPDIPIVVLTGLDSEEAALQAVKSGAQEYIVKGHGDSNVVRLAIKSSIERKAYERSLFQQANYDELTGLPNRRLFMEHLKQILIRAERWQRSEAIMFMDLNKFKEVNDTLGHEIGNKLLQQVACRIRASLRACDMVARYGGDEFIVRLDNHSGISVEECTVVANKIVELFRMPFEVNGRKFSIFASIGIALYPATGKNMDELIASADAAMYEAKQTGASYCFAKPRI